MKSTLINRRTQDGNWLQGCEHTTFLLNPKLRNEIIAQCSNSLKQYSSLFDTVACCGTSGLLVVPQITEILNKNILIVRKKNEQRYSPFLYEGVVPKNYIIIDDLICSGKTIKHILRTIKEDVPAAKCFGVYCFMKDKCAYANNNSCNKDLGIEYL